MPEDRKTIEAGLQAKGFRRENHRDHRYFTFFTLDGKRAPVFTKTSHGSSYRTLDDSLVARMAKQCKLTRTGFLDLVECRTRRAQYEAFLVEGNHL